MDTRMAVASVTANPGTAFQQCRPSIRGIEDRNQRHADGKTTVKPISFEPRKAACIGFMPPSRCRDMFSITTMASSTTIPWRSSAPMSERCRLLYRAGTITANVPTSGHRNRNRWNQYSPPVSQNKTKTTRMTRMTEPISVRSTSLTDARMSWCDPEQLLS